MGGNNYCCSGRIDGIFACFFYWTYDYNTEYVGSGEHRVCEGFYCNYTIWRHSFGRMFVLEAFLSSEPYACSARCVFSTTLSA